MDAPQRGQVVCRFGRWDQTPPRRSDAVRHEGVGRAFGGCASTAIDPIVVAVVQCSRVFKAQLSGGAARSWRSKGEGGGLLLSRSSDGVRLAAEHPRTLRKADALTMRAAVLGSAVVG